MKKKIPTLLICDTILALVIFAKVNIKNSLLSTLTTGSGIDTVNSVYTDNNWVAVLSMVLIGAALSMIALSKTKRLSQLFADILLVGIPGIILASWWKVLGETGWGFFISYQELMAYIGSLMVGVCIVKIIRYILRRDR